MNENRPVGFRLFIITGLLVLAAAVVAATDDCRKPGTVSYVLSRAMNLSGCQ
jgi:hypothetical protein